MWALLETAMGLLCNYLVGASQHTHYVIRWSPLCGVKALPAPKWSNSAASRGDRKKQKQKTLPWLSSSRSERRVSTASSPTDANPTQPIYIYIMPGIYYRRGLGLRVGGVLVGARGCCGVRVGLGRGWGERGSWEFGRIIFSFLFSARFLLLLLLLLLFFARFLLMLQLLLLLLLLLLDLSVWTFFFRFFRFFFSVHVRRLWSWRESLRATPRPCTTPWKGPSFCCRWHHLPYYY